MFTKMSKKIILCMMVAAFFIGTMEGGKNRTDAKSAATENNYVRIYRAAENKQSSITEIYNTYENKTQAVSVDLTGDGNEETVSIQVKDLGEYSHRILVKVDGKTALKTGKMTDLMNASAFYINLSAKKKFLWLCSTGANDDAELDTIYQYDKSSGTLKEVLELDSVLWKKGVSHIYTSVAVKNGALKVTYNGQMIATGYIKFSYIYQYKSGKFSLKSNTAKIKSKWHKGDFVARKNIVFYKKAGGNQIAFQIKPKGTVKLQKVKLYKNTYYLQFSYGKKKGWIYAGKYNIFKNVMLAG